MAREWAEPPIVGVGGVLDHVHGQYHLMPAPRDRAMVARSDRATVKRARFAFTEPPRTVVIQVDRVWQLGGLGEIPGFASPPRDGFALGSGSIGSERRSYCEPSGIRMTPGICQKY